MNKAGRILIHFAALLTVLIGCGTESPDTLDQTEIRFEELTICFDARPSQLVYSSTSQADGCSVEIDDSSNVAEEHFDGPGGSTGLGAIQIQPAFLELGITEVLVVPATAQVDAGEAVILETREIQSHAGRIKLHLLDHRPCADQCEVIVTLDGKTSLSIVPNTASGQFIQIGPYVSAQ